ncbi:MAG: SDR family NAD(P)-dependent oxidoreductase [Chromatiales bacterium]|jgi:NADP-dependent 3-hydroxy acid dehydrogenase YdfG
MPERWIGEWATKGDKDHHLAYPAAMNNGRIILITGCSSGIGRCVANGLKSKGYRVIATTRQSQDVENLSAAGLEALPLDLDCSHSIAEAVDKTLKRCGG